MSNRQTQALWIYAAGLLLLFVSSYLAAGAAFMVYDYLPPATQRATWVGLVLNGVAPWAAGLACGTALVIALVATGKFVPTVRGHLLRASTWYGLGAVLSAAVLSGRSNSDFGLYGQLVVWPLVSIAGALMVDILATYLRAQRAPAS